MHIRFYPMELSEFWIYINSCTFYVEPYLCINIKLYIIKSLLIYYYYFCFSYIILLFCNTQINIHLSIYLYFGSIIIITCFYLQSQTYTHFSFIKLHTYMVIKALYIICFVTPFVNCTLHGIFGIKCFY